MRPNRPLRRKIARRSPKKKFIIYTEGKNTEPDYFAALARTLRSTLIEIEIVGRVGVPLTVAKKAREHAVSLSRQKRRRSSFESQDEVWAVFDRDEHPEVASALDVCRGAAVGIAFSDPCFELWLILHLEDFDRPTDRHDVQAHFKSLCSEYDPARGKSANFARFMALVSAAERRAELQLERRLQEGKSPVAPCTMVFHLTRRLRGSGADDAHDTPR